MYNPCCCAIEADESAIQSFPIVSTIRREEWEIEGMELAWPRPEPESVRAELGLDCGRLCRMVGRPGGALMCALSHAARLGRALA